MQAPNAPVTPNAKTLAIIEDFDCLTKQQKRVANFILLGMSNKEIANQMQLTEGTVKIYISNMGIIDRKIFIVEYYKRRCAQLENRVEQLEHEATITPMC